MNMSVIEEKAAAEEQQDVQAELRGGEKHWMNRVLDCDVCFPHLDDTLPSASASTSTSKPVSAVVTEGQEQDMTPADKYSTLIGVSQSNGSSKADFAIGDVSQTDKYASVGGASQGNGKSRKDVPRSIASVAPPESYIVYSQSPVTLTSTMLKEEAKYGDPSTQSTSTWKQLFKKGKAPKAVQQQQQAIEKRQDTNTDGRRVSWRSMATNKAPKLNADHGRDMPPAYEPETSIPRGAKPLLKDWNGSPMLCGYGSCGGGGPMSPQHGQHYYYPQHPSSSPYGSNPSSPYGPYSPHHQQHFQQNYPPQQQQQQQQYQPQQQYPPQPQQHYQQNYPPY